MLEEGGFWDCLEEKHRGAGKEQVQPSSSRYASDYSWNSYPFFFRVFVSEYSYIVDWCGRKGLLRLLC